MKAERAYPRFTITAKGTRWVEGGHPWIYAQEIVSAPEGVENGALVDAVSEKGKYLGSGFFSRESKIRIRLLSCNANDRFDADFWRRRIRYAWDYRKTVMGADVSCCRVIFGEADGFPGLTVDRFENLLVMQTLSVGMERIKEMLFPLLVEVLAEDGVVTDGVFERNDAAIRALEGMEQGKGWFPLEGRDVPASAVTEICENGVYYRVDVENGQKTGFFLDQKYNRLAVARLARGRRVLDCFTHTGSFALNAARGGAELVVQKFLGAGQDGVLVLPAGAGQGQTHDAEHVLQGLIGPLHIAALAYGLHVGGRLPGVHPELAEGTETAVEVGLELVLEAAAVEPLEDHLAQLEQNDFVHYV